MNKDQLLSLTLRQLRLEASKLSVMRIVLHIKIKIPLENGVITNPKNLMIKNLVIFFMSS